MFHLRSYLYFPYESESEICYELWKHNSCANLLRIVAVYLGALGLLEFDDKAGDQTENRTDQRAKRQVFK